MSLDTVLGRSEAFWRRLPGWNRVSEQGLHAHVREEAEEFDAEPNGEEAADIVITVFMWAIKAGVDMEQEIRTKVLRNERRTWQVNEDGSYHHVKEAL